MSEEYTHVLEMRSNSFAVVPRHPSFPVTIFSFERFLEGDHYYVSRRTGTSGNVDVVSYGGQSIGAASERALNLAREKISRDSSTEKYMDRVSSAKGELVEIIKTE